MRKKYCPSKKTDKGEMDIENKVYLHVTAADTEKDQNGLLWAFWSLI